MKTSFGEWLKERIEERGITQAELARKIGVQAPQITHIIYGTRGTTPETLLAIARVLKLKPEIVYRAAGYLPPESEKTALIQQIEYIVGDLPREEQENILEYARLRQRIAEERGAYKDDDSRRTKTSAPAVE